MRRLLGLIFGTALIALLWVAVFEGVRWFRLRRSGEMRRLTSS